MANPRRTSYSSNQLPISDAIPQFQSQTHQSAATIFNSLKTFLKKPHAFPFLLSIFIILTWASLRFQHRYASPVSHQSSYTGNDKNGGYFKDSNANLVKFHSTSPLVMKDKRGWLVNPVSLALDAGLPGGAVYCASIHVGEIRPGAMRGNHRHHTCNETLVLWGAKTVFRTTERSRLSLGEKWGNSHKLLALNAPRLENKALTRGYSEATIGADEVAVVASPSGTAHALMNIDAIRSMFFIGCQDSVINYNVSTTDFNVWKDV